MFGAWCLVFCVLGLAMCVQFFGVRCSVFDDSRLSCVACCSLGVVCCALFVFVY